MNLATSKRWEDLQKKSIKEGKLESPFLREMSLCPGFTGKLHVVNQKGDRQSKQEQGTYLASL